MDLFMSQGASSSMNIAANWSRLTGRISPVKTIIFNLTLLSSSSKLMGLEELPVSLTSMVNRDEVGVLVVEEGGSAEEEEGRSDCDVCVLLTSLLFRSIPSDLLPLVSSLSEPDVDSSLSASNRADSGGEWREWGEGQGREPRGDTLIGVEGSKYVCATIGVVVPDGVWGVDCIVRMLDRLGLHGIEGGRDCVCVSS